MLLALPVAAQALTLPRTWLYWQGRYDLPTIAGILVLGASSLDRFLPSVPQLRRLATGVVVVAGFLQIVEFWSVLRRYAVGVLGSLNPLDWRNAWRPPLPILVLLGAATVAIALGYLLLLRLQRRCLGPRPGTLGEPDSDAPHLPKPPHPPDDTAAAGAATARYRRRGAGVAEAADAPGLGPGPERGGGSSPLARTDRPARGRQGIGPPGAQGLSNPARS